MGQERQAVKLVAGTYSKNHNQQGFTLIEIMVVLVIMAIVATFAMLTIGSIDQNSKLKVSAFELSSLIKLAEEYAMLKPQQIGLVIHGQSYQFRAYHIHDQDNPWQVIKTGLLSGKHQLPSSLQLSVEQADSDSPQILFYQNGQITPFVLMLTSINGQHGIRIFGAANGNISSHPS